MKPADLPLRDIHLPEPVGWWPLAPGWIALAILAFIAVVFLLVRLYLQRTRVHRIARRELGRIDARYRKDADAGALLRELSELLRRLALTRYPRAQVAALSDARWLDFLDGSDAERPFSCGAGKVLASGPYQPAAALAHDEAEALVALCRQRIETLAQ